jgi:hypothetical protein
MLFVRQNYKQISKNLSVKLLKPRDVFKSVGSMVQTSTCWRWRGLQVVGVGAGFIGFDAHQKHA